MASDSTKTVYCPPLCKIQPFQRHAKQLSLRSLLGASAPHNGDSRVVILAETPPCLQLRRPQTATASDGARAQMFHSNALVRRAARAADNGRFLAEPTPVNRDDAEAPKHLIDPNGLVERHSQAVWSPSGRRLVIPLPRAMCSTKVRLLARPCQFLAPVHTSSQRCQHVAKTGVDSCGLAETSENSISAST